MLGAGKEERVVVLGSVWEGGHGVVGGCKAALQQQQAQLDE